MKALFTVILFAFSVSIFAQHKIDIEIEDYQNDTLIAGYYIGASQLVHDTLFAEKPGKFKMHGDSTLDHGFYLLLTLPENNLIQFIIDEDQEFELSTKMSDLGNINFNGSDDNEQFAEYISFLGKIRPDAEAINKEIDALEENDPKIENLKKKLDKLDASVESKQQKIISDYPSSYTAKLLKSNISVEIPEFTGTEDEIKTQKYRFYKAHYFDNIDLSDSTILRTPFLNQRIDYYISKLTPNHPDSISQSIDYLLSEMEPAKPIYQYYLSNFLNKYAKSKIVGMDAIYVHLVDKYYSQGKADWVAEETLEKLIGNANDLRPVLVGKTGADITVYAEDGSEITLSELEYEYLVLLFWAPDCGHCKKSMPYVVEFYEEYKDKGVKLLAICTKHTDKTESCWKYVKEKEMDGFINAADKFHKSRFKTKYNVKSTPKIYILDQDRKIILKDIGGKQLPEVMEEIFKRAEQKKDK